MNLAEQLADTEPPPEPNFPKRCGCGRVYADEHAWKELRFNCFMQDGAGGELELRDCACHSTIAIELAACGC